MDEHRQLIKISLLGMPFSGKGTAFQTLVKLGILEQVPPNQSLGVLDSQFYFQPARISDFYIREKPELKEIYQRTLLFQWYSGPTLSATLLLELLVRDADGILFLVDPTPGKLPANEKSFDLLKRNFSRFQNRSLSDFPLVICYNRGDEFFQKLPQKQDSSPWKEELLIPEIKGEGVLMERQARSIEGKYITQIDQKLNQGHPWFLTSALYGYQMEQAFLKVLEGILKGG